MSEERFQIGEYWLSRQHNSPVWRATWFDAASRQTRRLSLGTKDFQAAKIALAEHALKNSNPKKQAPGDVPLGLVLVRYWEDYARNIPSAEAARFALALWTEFWGPATVGELTLERQEQFICWLKAKGHKNSYVSRTLSVGRAAVNRAWKREIITSKPFILDETDRSDEKEPYVLEIDEMRRLLEHARMLPHLYVFCMIMLNTLARPDAVLDLAPAQVNLKDRRIQLNPKGRKQTKKYRPVVPITDTLLPFVQDRECARFVLWWGRAVKSVDGAFGRTVARAGLSSEITPYSLRHSMAVELRRRKVSPWEVEGLMGHRRPGVTEKYAKYVPDYLGEASKAIDNYFAELGPKLGIPLSAA